MWVLVAVVAFADPAADGLADIFACCCCLSIPMVIVAIIWGLTSLAVGKPPHRVLVSRKGRCAKCDYDLTGLPTNHCPECGYINRATSAPSPQQPRGFEHDEQFWDGQ